MRKEGAGKWEEVVLPPKLHNGWEGPPNKTGTSRKLYGMKKQAQGSFQILSDGRFQVSNFYCCLVLSNRPLMAQIHWTEEEEDGQDLLVERRDSSLLMLSICL